MEAQYYSDKMESLREILQGENIRLRSGYLLVDEHTYPIVDDVIILLDSAFYPQSLKDRMRFNVDISGAGRYEFIKDIQFTFGEEWRRFSQILPEHEKEFYEYFDIVNLNELKNYRVCDLGCGNGRWSYFLKDRCRELVLVDFSDAIFVARHNLKDAKNVLFFMGDLQHLPFKTGFADFLFCLGVLHHLPTNALEEVKQLKKYSKKLLIYIYYSLDNKPVYLRALLAMVTVVRKLVSKVRNPFFRDCFTLFAVLTIYLPLIWMGKLLHPFGLSRYVPIYYGHYWMSLYGLRQVAYDRFFTSIEQRFSRKQIYTVLKDFFDNIVISDNPGYWHFLCFDD